MIDFILAIKQLRMSTGVKFRLEVILLYAENTQVQNILVIFFLSKCLYINNISQYFLMFAILSLIKILI